MSLEHLLQIAKELEPGELAEVIDLAARLRDRHAAEQGLSDDTAATLDAIASDPERLARFRAAIDVGWQQSERGQGRPLDDIVTDIKKLSRRRQGLE